MMDASDQLPDLGRLRLLVELSRVGTMAAVAERTGYGTSAVSKHLAVLEQEVGTRLLTPVGRRVARGEAAVSTRTHAVLTRRGA
ncbi:LysR family transcriptional regulator [Actinacidiphila glaucinigra]|uniref:helix-turn-helix domain-containing protein n=1 Tax=Actinacidiphila glaucinigra TaxID=235986 RepID=UPI003720C35A